MSIQILTVAEETRPEWERIISYLTKKGMIVRTAFTTNEAYKILKSEPIHIVLSEYHLSKISGLKFLAEAKTINPHLEIIFLSSQATLKKAIVAMKEGAYDFYEFPVNKQLLLAVIEKAMEKQLLHMEKARLERKIRDKFDLGKIVGKSKAINRVIEVLKSVSAKNVNILLTGETGTGKEIIANTIHYNSTRAAKPFIKMNCASFNENLLESELFGHEKGAFTGAIIQRIGRFEMADGGSLFLDEIGDLPLGTQIKLLRVLQEKEFERVGGNTTIKVDVRIIAAANQDLKKLIAERKFRDDLYYRLNIVHIELPPLRERKDDIPLMVSSFVYKLNKEKDYQIKGMTKEAMQILMNYQWPGNVRELENTVESAMAMVGKDTIEAKHLPAFLLFSQILNTEFYQIGSNLTLDEMEKEIIRLTLSKTGGNKTEAARILDIGLRTIQRKAKEL
jgi:DNA-binding NtrC family response regulator